jgi:hypothetical protein
VRGCHNVGDDLVVDRRPEGEITLGKFFWFAVISMMSNR